MDVDKPRLLAKVFLAFLAYLERRISWEDVQKYSEVIDRLLPGDREILVAGKQENINYSDVNDGLLRLTALGLMIAYQNHTKVEEKTLLLADARIQNYMRTKFGDIFADIIQR